LNRERAKPIRVTTCESLLRGNVRELAEPNRGVSFHACRDGGVLYDARVRRLYALNPAAALSWLTLYDGTPEAVTSALVETFGIDETVARAWAAASLSSFRALGLTEEPPQIEESPPISEEMLVRSHPDTEDKRVAEHLPPHAPDTERITVRLLEQYFELSYPAAVGPFLHGLLHPARAPRRAVTGPTMATIVIRISKLCAGYDIVVDNRAAARDVLLPELATAVEQELVTAAVAATPHLLTLHAGTIRSADDGLLLVGASGSGKSTLGAALVRAGWQYGGDELALLARSFSVRPVSLGVCIKRNSFGLIERWFPHFAAAATQNRFGREVRFLALENGFDETAVAAVVFPRYAPSAVPRATRMTGLDGLKRLLEECVFVPEGFEPEDVAGLMRWHESVAYFEIVFSDAEAAARAVREMVFGMMHSGHTDEK